MRSSMCWRRTPPRPDASTGNRSCGLLPPEKVRYDSIHRLVHNPLCRCPPRRYRVCMQFHRCSDALCRHSGGLKNSNTVAMRPTLVFVRLHNHRRRTSTSIADTDTKRVGATRTAGGKLATNTNGDSSRFPTVPVPNHIVKVIIKGVAHGTAPRILMILVYPSAR